MNEKEVLSNEFDNDELIIVKANDVKNLIIEKDNLTASLKKLSDEYIHSSCKLPPNGKYSKMKKTLSVMMYLRRIPKLFSDYNSSSENNRNMRRK